MGLFDDDVVSAFMEAEKRSQAEANLLFGPCEGGGGDSCTCAACDPPDDEFEIMMSSAMTLDQKLDKLRVLRRNKPVKLKSFRKRLTRTDAIHARGLGIRLD